MNNIDALDRIAQDSRAAFGSDTVIRLIAEIRSLQKTNRELHRRAQQVEAPAQSYRDQLEYIKNSYGDRWFHEFDRVLESHQEVQRIFHELCRAYDYPMGGKYLHSVMDSNVEKGHDSKEKGIYANCFLSKHGGMKSVRVLDEVRRAVDELLAARKQLP
jgi:hypothetical protein